MNKSESNEKDDSLDERYKGPGPIVAAAGYVSLYHWVAMVVSFVACGALGMLAAKPTIAAKEMFTEFSQANKTSSNWLMKIPAHVAGWIPRGADYIAHKVVSLGKNVVRDTIKTQPMSEQKLSAFMFAGGVGGAVGWIGSTIWGIIQGGHEGNVGKRQHDTIMALRKSEREQSKAEIKTLRERIDALEKKQAEPTTQNNASEPTTRVGSDTLKPEQRIHAHTEHATEHHGKVHAQPQHKHAAHTHA